MEEVCENSRCPDQSGEGVAVCSRHLCYDEPQMQHRMQYCRSSLISQLMWVLWCNMVYTVASVFLCEQYCYQQKIVTALLPQLAAEMGVQ